MIGNKNNGKKDDFVFTKIFRREKLRYDVFVSEKAFSSNSLIKTTIAHVFGHVIGCHHHNESMLKKYPYVNPVRPNKGKDIYGDPLGI